MAIQMLKYIVYLLSLTPLLTWAHPTAISSTPHSDLNQTLAKSLLYAPPLFIAGEELVAKVQRRAAEDLPVIEFSDVAEDTPRKDKILSNFLETGNLDREWSTPICEAITKFDPAVNGNSGIFNYNIQGTHKHLLSLVHDQKFLHLYATFTTTNAELLSKFDLMAVCKSAVHQAAQTNHELKYGFFGTQTVYSMLNNHLIRVEPVTDPAGNERRSSFGGPIGIINIQIGDKADGVDLFNLNGLPI